MKYLFYGGMAYCGYATFQLLGFIASAFPSSRVGAIGIIILLMLIIVAMGVTNWCGLYYKKLGILTRSESVIGFAPTFVFGSLALLAVSIGVTIAR